MFGIFGKKTVAGVMAVFETSISQLELVVVQNKEEIERQAQIILEADTKRGHARQEVDNALDVAAKLRALVRPMARAANPLRQAA